MEAKTKAKGGIIKGAATIAAGGLAAKLIGALYRIPLTNLIGGEGIGLYQLVYPFYCLLLTVSATGIPSSIATLTARRIARGEDVKPLFSTCMRLFLCIGGASTVLMIALAPVLSRVQGEAALWSGYLALSPAVLTVSAISVFRGYFQGKGNMTPTAVSEIVEQAVKVGAGLLLAYFFRDNLYRAVTALLIAVSVSEAVALAFLTLVYRRDRRTLLNAPVKGEKPRVKSILKLSVPVTLSAILLPLSGLIDSVLIVRLLRAHTENAVALYGLFSGGAVTVINLPVSVCYGIAAATVPALSAAVEKGESGRKKMLFSALLTLGLGALAAAALFFLAEPAVRILYRSLTGEQLNTLVRLVKLYAVSAATLSLTQTLSACLTALGKPGRAAISMAAAMILKTALNFLLVRNPNLSVYGAALAANAGYLVSALLDFSFAVYYTRKKRA
ncbi:MAG: polysaccharide biosynthesis protein [Clostridia bacterium]|nr:polysaccharide biosynthesis protein [Clostridia bacterium]